MRLGEFDVDLSAARDLSIPIRFDDPAFAQGARAFSLPAASTRAVEGGGFVGDVRRGGSCNCETHTFTPHGDGTHTEGPGHILRSRRPVVVGDVVCIAVVVRVTPRLLGESVDDVAGNHRHDDVVVDTDAVSARLDAALQSDGRSELVPTALIIATAAGALRRRQQHSGTNPPYLTPDAATFIRERGFVHLLVDLPSLDRENDGGLLSAHHAFFDIPPGATDSGDRDSDVADRSVTELIAVDDDVAEGIYALFLQLAPIVADAAPSRPLIAPLLTSAFFRPTEPARGAAP